MQLKRSFVIIWLVPSPRLDEINQGIFLGGCRVMNAGPYNLNKKSEECATAEYNGANFSATAPAGSSVLSAKQGL